MSDNIREIKCPTCGGKIKYDPHSGMNHCDACGNYYYINPYNNDNKIDEINKSRCPNCGGQLHFEIGTDTISCSSCDSIFQIVIPESSKDQVGDGFEPDYIIPFTVTEEQLKNEFIDVLAATDYVPMDVFDKIGFDYIRGYYQPYYRIKAVHDTDYTALVGFDRKEQYEDYERVYENGRTYNKRVIKERTVTDWHPISGHTKGSAVLWSSGIKNNKTNIAYSIELREEKGAKNQELIKAYDKIVQQTDDSGKPFNQKYTAGFDVTPFSRNETDAWNALKEDIHAIIDDDVKSQLSGDHIKDIHWSSTYEPRETDTFYVPIWVISYCYGGSHHTFIANGSSLKLNYLSKPQDTASIKKAKLFYLPLKIWGGLFGAYAFLLLMLILFGTGDYKVYDFMMSGIPWLLGFGLITWLIGYIGKKSHLSTEKTKRNIEKEKIKKNLNSFFARTASYALSKSKEEKTEPPLSGDNTSESVDKTKKKAIFSLLKKNKKIVAITASIAAFVIILTAVLTNVNFGKSTTYTGSNSNSSKSFGYTSTSERNTSIVRKKDITENTSEDPTGNSENSSAESSVGGSGNDLTESLTWNPAENLTENSAWNPANSSAGGSNGGGSNGSSGNFSNSSSGGFNGGSASSSSGGSTVNPATGSSGETQNNNPCANGHRWVAIEKTVHHDEQGHYENVQESKKVTKYKCQVCYNKFDSVDDYYSHFDAEHIGGTISIFRERYETVDDREYYQTEEWVVDKAAYDETVITGYKCSVCSATK
mgnify:CR=1 FL=1